MPDNSNPKRVVYSARTRELVQLRDAGRVTQAEVNASIWRDAITQVAPSANTRSLMRLRSKSKASAEQVELSLMRDVVDQGFLTPSGSPMGAIDLARLGPIRPDELDEIIRTMLERDANRTQHPDPHSLRGWQSDSSPAKRGFWAGLGRLFGRGGK